MDQTQPNPPQHANQGGWNATRLIATLVLFPTIPMLLISVAALAFFYLAPVRFGDLIAQLPGETFIRTALVFAPATLFAIVILAVLYAVEKPKEVEIAEKAERVAPRRWSARWVARAALVPSLPALVISTGLWALSFVAPGRFDRLMEPFPGDSYLRPLVPFAPPLLMVIVVVAIFFAVLYDPERARGARAPRLASLGVGFVLVSALPTLLISLAALGLYRFDPDQFASWFDRLSDGTFTRLVLVFAPAMLFALVVIAVLYLWGEKVRSVIESRRSTIALSVMGVGLFLTSVFGMALLGVIVFLLLR
jgi:hypothetical protein